MTGTSRLLIVEDNRGVLEALSEWFTSLGYEVETVMDGKRAVDRFRDWAPDVVLLDLWLPLKSGAEVLAEMMQIDASVPVLIVSADDDVALAQSLIRQGAYDYLPKPAVFTDLERAVDSAVAYRRTVAPRRRPA
jgi:DNA-binding NtrC family response regulator